MGLNPFTAGKWRRTLENNVHPHESHLIRIIIIFFHSDVPSKIDFEIVHFDNSAL